MSKRNWRYFIADILECIRKIKIYTSGMSYDDFMKDDKTKDAVLRNLEIIGEAAKQISRNIREKYEEIPWKQIIGLRNRLIHGYFVVDYDIVWDIVKKELPELEIKMEKILQNMKKEI